MSLCFSALAVLSMLSLASAQSQVRSFTSRESRPPGLLSNTRSLVLRILCCLQKIFFNILHKKTETSLVGSVCADAQYLPPCIPRCRRHGRISENLCTDSKFDFLTEGFQIVIKRPQFLGGQFSHLNPWSPTHSSTFIIYFPDCELYIDKAWFQFIFSILELNFSSIYTPSVCIFCS